MLVLEVPTNWKAVLSPAGGETLSFGRATEALARFVIHTSGLPRLTDDVEQIKSRNVTKALGT